MRTWIKIAATLLIAVCAGAGYQSWKSHRRDLAQLQSALAAANQALTAATNRQQDRDAQLAKTLSTLDAAKRHSAQSTPAQIIQNLPTLISLPKPITLPAAAHSPAESQAASPLALAPEKSSAPTAPAAASLPLEDLQPLQSFALDCQACQAKLAAAQADLQDERAKTQALASARDAAVRTARSGGTWQRIARAAKWFGLGAAAGLLAAKATH